MELVVKQRLVPEKWSGFGRKLPLKLTQHIFYHFLKFEKFVNGTISRVNGRLITLARIRKLLDLRTCLLIYKQTILPIFDYVSILVNLSTCGKLQNYNHCKIRR